MGPAHLGIGFAAKPAAPKVPLWVLLVASEALDLLSFVFISTGIEKMAITETTLTDGLKFVTPGSVPWSHGLLMSLVWSFGFAGIGYWVFKDGRASLIIGLVVFSHWLLDFLVHPPDLPLLLANSPSVGLGLWTSGPGLIVSMFLELILLGGGIFIYRTTRNRKQEKL